jgi:uncharacterized protein (UPF0254 family)|tara:strand:- start:2589 stop:2780 length:192 start_codon:yes stop_codon:yes gene_type:complete
MVAVITQVIILMKIGIIVATQLITTITGVIIIAAVEQPAPDQSHVTRGKFYLRENPPHLTLKP